MELEGCHQQVGLRWGLPWILNVGLLNDQLDIFKVSIVLPFEFVEHKMLLISHLSALYHNWALMVCIRISGSFKLEMVELATIIF